MLKTARDEVILPYWRQLIDGIHLAVQYHILLLSCTYGQPATPSTIGKEMATYCMWSARAASLTR